MEAIWGTTEGIWTNVRAGDKGIEIGGQPVRAELAKMDEGGAVGLYEHERGEQVDAVAREDFAIDVGDVTKAAETFPLDEPLGLGN